MPNAPDLTQQEKRMLEKSKGLENALHEKGERVKGKDHGVWNNGVLLSRDVVD